MAVANGADEQELAAFEALPVQRQNRILWMSQKAVQRDITEIRRMVTGQSPLAYASRIWLALPTIATVAMAVAIFVRR